MGSMAIPDWRTRADLVGTDWWWGDSVIRVERKSFDPKRVICRTVYPEPLQGSRNMTSDTLVAGILEYGRPSYGEWTWVK